MQASFKCPNCSKELQADPSFSGRQTQCPQCNSTFIIPELNVAVTAAEPKELKDFFVLRWLACLSKLLGKGNFLEKVGNLRDLLVKCGLFAYWILGLLLFIVSCCMTDVMGASAVGYGIGLFAAMVIVPSCSLFMFPLYNKVFKENKAQAAPAEFLTVVSLFALIGSLAAIIVGIVISCKAECIEPFFNGLVAFAVLVPLLIVCVVPKQISISTDEQKASDYGIGILRFFSRYALFLVPFLWSMYSLFSIIYVITHLGAGKEGLAEALVKISGNGLYEVVTLPLSMYVAYLIFELIVSAIEGLVKLAKHE